MRIRGARQKRDWLQTARQSLPGAWRVIRNLRPTHELRSLADLDAAFVRREAIRGLLWDVDGTLTHYHARSTAPEADPPLAGLLALPDLRHAIVSNCDEARYAELGRMYPSIPILKLYGTAGGHVGRRLEHGVDTWIEPDGGGVASRTLQDELVPVRKPSAQLMMFATSQLGLSPPEVGMVGDQFWTDVAGANMAGLRSIHVPTIGRYTFPVALRVFQRLDCWLRRFLA